MSNMRIGGLASGMDIDQIVGDLMKAERMPLNKLKQKKTQLEWRQNDYRSMNTLLLDFRKELMNMKLSSTYRARTVTSMAEEKVTADATSGATQGSFTISQIDQMATAATKVNAGSISGLTKVDQSKALYEQKNNFANTWNWDQGSVESRTIIPTVESNKVPLTMDEGTLVKYPDKMKVKVDGKVYEFVPGNTPPANDNQVSYDPSTKELLFKNNIKTTSTVYVEYIADKEYEKTTVPADTTEIKLGKSYINTVESIKIDGTEYKVDAVTGVVSLASDTLNNKVGTFDFTTGTFKADFTITKGRVVETTYTQNYFDFKLSTHTSNGQMTESFAVQGSETLSGVMNRVNTSTLGLTMFYDSMKDQLTLTRTETGNYNGTDSKDPAFTQADHEIITSPDSTDFINSALRFTGVSEQGGDNIKFTINGLKTERTSNTFEMNGVNFTIKQKFTEPVTMSVNNDSTKVFDNIKAFVEKYNELIDKIQKKTSEDYYRDFLPLTDEQRESLSDKQQEQWEEKAKSGLLRRDPILTEVLSNMRIDFYAPVSNVDVNPIYNQLASIGITTSNIYQEGGKLIIDEAKLKKAIQDDPASVEKLFNADGATSSQKGIAQRLYESVNTTMDKLKARAGNAFSTSQQFVIGKELLNIDNQINRFEDRLIKVEDRYWRQFTAMEKAIQRANSQSAYLMQQFSM
jgi:flagellar hook-associated protein 2